MHVMCVGIEKESLGCGESSPTYGVTPSRGSLDPALLAGVGTVSRVLVEGTEWELSTTPPPLLPEGEDVCVVVNLCEENPLPTACVGLGTTHGLLSAGWDPASVVVVVSIPSPNPSPTPPPASSSLPGGGLRGDGSDVLALVKMADFGVEQGVRMIFVEGDALCRFVDALCGMCVDGDGGKAMTCAFPWRETFPLAVGRVGMGSPEEAYDLAVETLGFDGVDADCVYAGLVMAQVSAITPEMGSYVLTRQDLNAVLVDLGSSVPPECLGVGGGINPLRVHLAPPTGHPDLDSESMHVFDSSLGSGGSVASQLPPLLTMASIFLPSSFISFLASHLSDARAWLRTDAGLFFLDKYAPAPSSTTLSSTHSSPSTPSPSTHSPPTRSFKDMILNLEHTLDHLPSPPSSKP